jgi:hypothetical protein
LHRWLPCRASWTTGLSRGGAELKRVARIKTASGARLELGAARGCRAQESERENRKSDRDKKGGDRAAWS